MKFGTHWEDTPKKIFGYKATAHFAHNNNGGQSKMAASQYRNNGTFSRVNYLSSMTIRWLTCLDDWCDK
jgi:hypothetical protein